MSSTVEHTFSINPCVCIYAADVRPILMPDGMSEPLMYRDETTHNHSSCRLSSFGSHIIEMMHELTAEYPSDSHKPSCRFEEARTALFKALGSRELFGVPLLVLANKQDLQDAQPPEAVEQMLGLDELKLPFRWESLNFLLTVQMRARGQA